MSSDTHVPMTHLAPMFKRGTGQQAENRISQKSPEASCALAFR